MRIELDRDKCTGHGRCYSLAPHLFTPDDVGYCEDPPDAVPAGLEAAARIGAESCPEGALTVLED